MIHNRTKPLPQKPMIEMDEVEVLNEINKLFQMGILDKQFVTIQKQKLKDAEIISHHTKFLTQSELKDFLTTM